MITSSENLLRCIITVDIADKKLDQIISVSHRIHTVQCRSCKIQAALLCTLCPTDKLFPPKLLLPADNNSFSYRYLHAESVTPEHFKVRAHMMCQRNRLCFLQMRKARHIGLNIFLHQFQKNGLKKFFQPACQYQ